ncbi:MAG TPA: hypothetical protein VM261_37500 [Kofleriaceae bacterium]|nr:hypothetical protein [Kofleriaceae bacterium]
MRRSGWGLLLVVMLLAPRAASAESKEELTRSLEKLVDFVPEPGRYTTMRHLFEPSELRECRRVVRRASETLAGDDELISPRFGGSPDARRVGDAWAVKVDDLPWLCTLMDHRLDEIRLIEYIALGKRWEGLLARGFTDDDRRKMTAADARGTQAVVRECEMLVAAVATALKMDAADGNQDGKLGDDVAAPHAYLSLADARPCEAMKQWNDVYQAEWKTQLAVFAKPLEDAGVGGDRLETLLGHAPVTFYAPGVDGWVIEGCKQVKTMTQLKKAKELVRVQATQDHQIVLVRFQFKGDTKVTTSEKVFPTAKAAFKSRCRI